MRDHQALLIVLSEYNAATQRHPVFCENPDQAVAIIAEELGELAKVINDTKTTINSDWADCAIYEAAHVAVTAIRAIEQLLDLKVTK